jgi:hypothetical protein
MVRLLFSFPQFEFRHSVTRHFGLRPKNRGAFFVAKRRHTVAESQGSALAENENELKIEREWRQQLETAAVNEKEAAARLREEVAFLQKVAGVS